MNVDTKPFLRSKLTKKQTPKKTLSLIQSLFKSIILSQKTMEKLKLCALALAAFAALQNADATTWTTGQVVEDGDFYLYNIGTSMFLNAGDPQKKLGYTRLPEQSLRLQSNPCGQGWRFYHQDALQQRRIKKLPH